MPADPHAGKPKKLNGWQQLRLERERNFTGNFKPLLKAMQRNEFLSSIVELFVNALVGVGRINLGAEDTKPSDHSIPKKEVQDS